MSDVVDSAGPAVGDLLASGRGHVHLLGICGVGMAGLALLLRRRGFVVSGCDEAPNRLAAWLAGHGIGVRRGHLSDHLGPDVSWLVRSAAVPPDAPEVLCARGRGLPVFVRGAVLPALLAGRRSVAVSGTHGKTTTATFIAQLLRHAGRDPSWCIGGECPALGGGVAGAGAGLDLVVEADESDGTVALYRPDIAVINNIEFDHMEHFADVAAFEGCFRALAANTRGRVVYGADDPRAASVCRSLPRRLSFGLDRPAELIASGLRADAGALAFTVERGGRALGPVRLPVGGRHNALNALAAIGAALELGLSFDEIRAGLERVELPRRRFERVADRGGILVISDYAHHPTEIAALVRMAASLGRRRLLGIFQPHRYTRTRALGPNFPAAFRGLDRLVLAPVYAASEPRLEGGDSGALLDHWRAQCPDQTPALAGSLEEGWDWLKRELKAGDALLVIGAGDVEKVAEWAREALEAFPI